MQACAINAARGLKMLAYIMVKDGELVVIPVDINLRNFTHITVRNRVFKRELLMRKLQYHEINDRRTPVFLLSSTEFEHPE